jgi:hypothetical protein
MKSLNPFEQRVLEAFLKGDPPELAMLRKQIAKLEVRNRTHTGVGCFVDFQLPPTVARVTPAEMAFGDVNLEVEGITAPVSTLLYVIGGAIHFLEIAADEGEWPKEPVITRLNYLKSVKLVDGYDLVPSDERDPAALKLSLAGRQGQKK